MCVQKAVTWAEPRSGDEKSGFCRCHAVAGQCYTVFQRSITAPNLEVAMEPTRRKLTWIEEKHFWGWGCSECAWLFRPLGPLVGQSIGDMKVHYEQQRDQEFASHVCAKHPRAPKNPG
jgi:hypothetical protein